MDRRAELETYYARIEAWLRQRLAPQFAHNIDTLMRAARSGKGSALIATTPDNRVLLAINSPLEGLGRSDIFVTELSPESAEAQAVELRKAAAVAAGRTELGMQS